MGMPTRARVKFNRSRPLRPGPKTGGRVFCLSQPDKMRVVRMEHNSLLLLLLLVSMIVTVSAPAPPVPGLDTVAYHVDGDLMLGMMRRFFGTASLVPASCSADLVDITTPQRAEMVNFAIQEVNERQDLLPNITMGFVILDTCGKDRIALGQATRFTDRDSEKGQCIEPEKQHEPDDADVLTTYKILGLIGATSSSESVMVGSYLSVFHIPLVSPTATSDELSDKTRFEYFSRLMPPDRFQAEVMVDIMLHYNWTYISLVYNTGSYGENGARQVEINTKKRGICIAFQHRVSSTVDNNEYETIVDGLARNMKARVVVLFMKTRFYEGFISAVSKRDLQNHFFWLAADTGLNIRSEEMAGTVFPSFVTGPIPGFEEHYRNLAPWKSTNPWLKEAWAMEFDCSWTVKDSANSSCYQYSSFGDSPSLYMSLFNGKGYEAVYVYAHALHNLLSSKCPESFVNKSVLDSCVTGPDLLRFIRNVTVSVHGNTLAFDEAGDVKPVYNIRQLMWTDSGKLETVVVGRWDKYNGGLSMDDSIVTFYHNTSRAGQGPVDSVCSRPCKAKEYAVHLDLSCCWDCRTCRENEVIAQTDLGTGCTACPDFTWSDNVTQTVCEVIDPSFLQLNDPIAVSLMTLALLGLIVSVFCQIAFVYFRGHKLIKASSRELGTLTLLGISFAFLGVFTFVAKPASAICLLRPLIFHLAVNMMYSPVMVKMVRIYRIFASAKLGKKPPSFIAPGLQIGFCLVLFAVQVMVVGCLQIAHPSSPTRQMPLQLERYVELLCEHNRTGFLMPVVYNMLVLMVCARLGVATRKLPENFNESWFIFICVATTLFMWMVFLPCYFFAFYAYHQAALLALCLLVNAYVTMACLFLSKIYAVLFVNEDKLKITYATTTVTSVSVQPVTISNEGGGGP